MRSCTPTWVSTATCSGFGVVKRRQQGSDCVGQAVSWWSRIAFARLERELGLTGPNWKLRRIVVARQNL